MFDACTITRASTTPPVLNQSTGQYDHPAQVTVYSGKCRVKGNARNDHVREAGDQPLTFYRFTVSVPMSATVFEVDDTVHITSSALDPALAGVRMRVREPEFGSQITARRLGCEVNAS